MYDEKQALQKSRETPNEYFVLLFHTQVYKWILVGPTAAKACIDSGRTSRSQCRGFLRGHCVDDWEAPIDTAYVYNNELYAESWIRQMATEHGYEVIEETEGKMHEFDTGEGEIVRLVLETAAGDNYRVFELPNYMNWDPKEKA